MGQRTIDGRHRRIEIEVVRHREVEVNRGSRIDPVDQVDRVAALEDQLVHQIVIREHRDDRDAFDVLEFLSERHEGCLALGPALVFRHLIRLRRRAARQRK